jgi:hypothetical protein
VIRWYLGALVIGILAGVIGFLKSRQQSDVSAEWMRAAQYDRTGY